MNQIKNTSNEKKADIWAKIIVIISIIFGVITSTFSFLLYIYYFQFTPGLQPRGNVFTYAGASEATHWGAKFVGTHLVLYILFSIIAIIYLKRRPQYIIHRLHNVIGGGLGLFIASFYFFITQPSQIIFGVYDNKGFGQDYVFFLANGIFGIFPGAFAVMAGSSIACTISKLRGNASGPFSPILATAYVLYMSLFIYLFSSFYSGSEQPQPTTTQLSVEPGIQLSLEPGATDIRVCTMATRNKDGEWEKNPMFNHWIEEAQKRELSRRDCLKLRFENEAPGKQTSSQHSLELSATDTRVCDMATANGEWQEFRAFELWVEEARKRGLTRTDCEKLLEAMFGGHGIEPGATDTRVCDLAIRHSDGEWEKDPDFGIWVGEAQKRELTLTDCEMLLKPK